MIWQRKTLKFLGMPASEESWIRIKKGGRTLWSLMLGQKSSTYSSLPQHRDHKFVTRTARKRKHNSIQCSFKAFFTEVSNTKMSLMAPLQPTSRGWLSVMNTPLEVGFDGAIWSWRHSCRASPWETIRIGTEGGLGLRNDLRAHERLLGSLWKTSTTNADFRFSFFHWV